MPTQIEVVTKADLENVRCVDLLKRAYLLQIGRASLDYVET